MRRTKNGAGTFAGGGVEEPGEDGLWGAERGGNCRGYEVRLGGEPGLAGLAGSGKLMG